MHSPAKPNILYCVLASVLYAHTYGVKRLIVNHMHVAAWYSKQITDKLLHALYSSARTNISSTCLTTIISTEDQYAATGPDPELR